MPPKKPPPASASQRSLAVPAASAAYERKPTPVPPVPDAASILPLWTPSSTPKELFPEWPSAAALATENWGSDDAPFEDPTPPTGFLATSTSVKWKRPSEFLPPILEPTPPAAAGLPPVVADPKHAAAKKAVPPSTAKKGEPEPLKKPKPPRYAHVVFAHSAGGHQLYHSITGPLPQPTHPGTLADVKKLAAAASGAPPVATASLPSTPAVAAPPQRPPHRILHDFRRLWSAEQEDELAAWCREEDRIERDKAHRERVYMDFEDAIAFIINERPRTLNEDNVNAEDLEDDGEDEDEQDEDGGTTNSSPYGGFLPPAKIDIAGNAVVKPEVPHGDVVQPEFASYFRVVDQIYQQWSCSPQATDVNQSQYLWEAIHPQDAQGVPIYNAAGKYSVRLYVAGKWRRVDVDDKLPVDDENNVQIASSSVKNELWVSILTKALVKVANWIGVDEDVVSPSNRGSPSVNKLSESICLASLVITALTSWKVTPHNTAEVFAGNYQSLQEFVPQVHPFEPQNELSLDGSEENATELNEPSKTKATKEAGDLMPRAVMYSTSTTCSLNLAFREAALLLDIVGDPGSVTFKTVNLNGPASIKEEDLSADIATFLILHPPQRHSDLLMEVWSVDASGVAEPFPNAATQFCVINSMKKTEAQSAGDTSAERTPPQENFVNVLVTLSRIPPSSSGNADDPSTNSEIAKHLGVDPRGSVLLVEDVALEQYRFRLSGRTRQPRRPMVFKVDTSSSALLQLPRGDFESMTFRVYPQSMCRYGYSLLVESDVKVDWQIPSTYWRNVWDLQVIEGDGAYQAMLPGSWNILFKQNIELAPPAEVPSDHTSVCPEVHVDLHLSDPDLASAVHVFIVNQQGDCVAALSGLHGGVLLPQEAATYTLIVECRPKAMIPEGKWHLTIGSNRFFKHAAIHQPRLTIFSGVYVPNKPLVCFRDVVQQPKKTTITSLQFELLDSDLNVARDLAAHLQIVDVAGGQELAQQSAPGMVRMLQMPPYTKGADDPNEDKSGYIIQCGIDRTKCHVPVWAQSVRPFRNKQPEPPKEKPIEEGQELQEQSPKEVNPHELKWRLMCWSVGEVKLEFDRTQELRFDAIRASWVEAAKDRDAHGASSRLLFLGKFDAAEAAMMEDSLTEEQMTKYKARPEWLRESRTRVTGLSEHDHIDVQPERSREDEVLLQPEDIERDHERNQIMSDEMNAFLQSIRDERALAKETRAAALKDEVQSFIDQRKETEKHMQALYAQRDDVRAQSYDAASTVGAAG